MRFLFLVALLLAGPALGQQAWYPGPIQTMGFDSNSRKVTTAFGAQTQFARIICTEDCYVAFASSNANSAATAYQQGATSVLVPADTPETFRVSPNGWVAVIRVSTNGTFSVMELTR
jgi:hypothetical protein